MSWLMLKDVENFIEDPVLAYFIIIIFGAIVSIILGSLVFIDSKDILWIYNSSPRGAKDLVFSYLIMVFILNIIISTILTTFLMVVIQTGLIFGLYFYTLNITFNQLMLCQTIAIQCFNPSFDTKSKSMQTNTLLSMGLMQISLISIVCAIFTSIYLDIPLESLISYFVGALLLINIAISGLLLKYGLKKLSKIE
ncbi:MAG: hypothetical protein GF317_10845 [Candidatus Lokiarchaeota archaeon]|nr:hypothetical protein [Candidatus Lokiarchaeota archaeon]MBD3200159.1 hypothetical protein [Candidatus Lokiarchaeota archaeon]